MMIGSFSILVPLVFVVVNEDDFFANFIGQLIR